ncbi:MAG: 1-(5-phosphoribosyl)-5-[Clostridia bacterium]|nr:1-(5-phosphoribosyl)-5-[(5-phosphoribosylamino)methylideneamino]imidazole-4-carboxamide isomerase [Clostridia bacterium]
MIIFPATDIKDGKVVRLTKGDYGQMKVYSSNALEKALEFKNAGAEYLHMVDLDGAKDGEMKNFSVIQDVVKNSGMKIQIGGGIRNEQTIKKYVDAGVLRVILGTIAVKDTAFLKNMISEYGDKIAVGVDIKGEMIAVNGWMEDSGVNCFEFMETLCNMGCKTVICTDISKDGLLKGTNLPLYKRLKKDYNIDVVASGGITGNDDISALCDMDMYGAILGKALYEGKIDLKDALHIAGRI